MADWSQTFIVVKGDEDTLKAVETDIRRFAIDEYDSYLVFSCDLLNEVFGNIQEYKENGLDSQNDFQINNLEIENGVLRIQGEGRYGAPIGFFEMLAKKHKVDMEFVDACKTYDFTSYFRAENGEVVERDIDDYHSPLTIKVVFNGDVNDYYQSNNWAYVNDDKELIQKIEQAVKKYKSMQANQNSPKPSKKRAAGVKL